MHPIFIYYNPATCKYVVVESEKHNWKRCNTAWMQNSSIGNDAHVPILDVHDSLYTFTTENAALLYVAKLYAKQANSYLQKEKISE